MTEETSGRWRPGVAAVAVVLAIVLGASGCGAGSSGAPASPSSAPAPTPSLPPGPIPPTALAGQTYSVGGQDTDEQLLLCKMATVALAAHGAAVTDRCGVAGSRALRQALTSGQVDVVWRYTGSGWITDLGRTDVITDPQRQYTAVRDADAPNGLSWLPPTPFSNTFAIATTRAVAQQNGLRTTSDWARLVESGSPEATTCVEPDFAVRDDGLPGLLRAYGVTRPYAGPPSVTTLDVDGIYRSAAAGTPCRFGEVFSTDGRLPALDLVTLTDDRAFFPVYNASPLFRTPTLERAPAAGRVLTDIAERLTYPTILGLNAQVSSQRRAPEDVARTWLSEQGLIS